MPGNGGVCILGLLVKPGEPGNTKSLIAPGIFLMFWLHGLCSVFVCWDSY